MRLVEDMPKSWMMPVHPDTLEYWEERMVELEELRLSGEKIDDLKGKTQFKEAPLVMENVILMGGHHSMAVKEIPKSFECHPETWKNLDQHIKDKFILV